MNGFARLVSVRAHAYDVAHVSSAHPWTDNRVHMREAASAAKHFSTLLIAVTSPTQVTGTGVDVVTLPRRRRIGRILVNTVEAITLAVASRASVIHLHDPELVWSVPILRSLGRRVVFDAHEDLPDQFRNRDYVPRWAHDIVRRLAHAVIHVASMSDHIVAATAITARRYPPSKTTVVHNFPRLRAEEASLLPLAARPPVAAYIGVVSSTRGAQTMCDASRSQAFPPGWRIDIAGPCSPESLRLDLDAVAASAPLTMHGLLAPEVARDLLLRSRIGIVVLRGTDAYRNALATKMFEYMAAGIPVIASDFPLWVDLLQPYDCATFVRPDDPLALAQAIARYSSDPALLARHGANGRRAAETVFNWDSEEAALLRVYSSLGLGSISHGTL